MLLAHTRVRRTLCCLAVLLVSAAPAIGQTRDEQVRQDRAILQSDDSWHYDDLDAGFAAAKQSGKPLMVVLRCIP